MTINDGLKAPYRPAIISILTACERVQRIVLFGSRAMGTFTTTSDVDIVLFGDALTLTDHADLAEQIEELSIAQSVDLVLYHTIKNKALQKHIKDYGVDWWVMGSEFVSNTLGEIVTSGGGVIQTGPFGSQLHASDYVANGIPVIMPANINWGRVDLIDIARIKQKDADQLSKHIVKSGDIVYSRRGDVTRKALITESEEGMFCGTGCLLVRVGNLINARFLYYHLSSPTNQEWIIRHAVGATMPNLNTGILRQIPLQVPSITYQKAIAHILGSLDDKIELNRKMNETL
ncbi:MAG: restriction endonuclease subunit S, partial [Mariprofundaceae bacterium]|nr:restriction endonuclease subunit S [Mariprofundaceae bacterium]